MESNNTTNHTDIQSPESNHPPESETRLSQSPPVSKLKKFLLSASLPWSLLLMTLILLGLVVYGYQYGIGYFGRQRLDTPNMDVYVFHSHPYFFEDFPPFQSHWTELDRKMDYIFDQQEHLWNTTETYFPHSGKYSGSYIKNNTMFTYSIEIGENSLSGSFSGTDSGSLSTLVQNIRNIGYRVESSAQGYVFSGDKKHAEKLIELLGR